MKHHYVFIRKKKLKIAKSVGSLTCLESKLQSKSQYFFKTMGPLHGEIYAVVCDFTTPKNTFLAFSLSVYKKQGEVAHVYTTTINMHVCGRSLCIFRTFGLLIVELGRFENQFFFSKMAINCSKQTRTVKNSILPIPEPHKM